MKQLQGPRAEDAGPEGAGSSVTDLYYDLRERRLLPLVALVLVAIVAVPFLLSSGSEPEACSRRAWSGCQPPSQCLSS